VGRAHGGLVYGYAPDPKHPGKFAVCDGDKYFWVQAESIAAAALLAVRTGEGGYWDWYDRCGSTAGSTSSTTATARGTGC
jgi:mannose/cellobiose epimerase-like protein (N-acyl-D-glucosamine 2-epimerase family)